MRCPEPPAPSADQDLARCELIVDLLRQLNSWRELAHEAIHHLHALHHQHHALRQNYYRVLEDNRTLRRPRRPEAA